MTDEQNQTLLRAFANAPNRQQAATDEAFVAAVAARVRSRRRLLSRLRLFAVGLVLIVAAVLAPLVAPAGVWLVRATLWLFAGVGTLAASTAGLVTLGALAFAAVVSAWAMRRG